MQLSAPACQTWRVIHSRHSWWIPLHCQDCPGILGLTLPEHLELDLWSSVHHAHFWYALVHMDHSNTWYPSPYLISLGSKNFHCSPNSNNSLYPLPFWSIELTFILWAWHAKYFTPLFHMHTCSGFKNTLLLCFYSFSEYRDFF